MTCVTQGCVRRQEGKRLSGGSNHCGYTRGILRVASYGTSDRLGSGQSWAIIPGGSGATGVSSQYFSRITHPASKQLHPLASEAALHFSPLGYHAKEEISAQEEGFGQVQREGFGEWKVL